MIFFGVVARSGGAGAGLQRGAGLQLLRRRASFRDMACASKLAVFTFAFWCAAVSASAQAPRATNAAAAREAAELQFELARSLLQMGEHEAAAREFDRAVSLQREASHATVERTEAVLRSVRSYVASRPELPRIRQIERRLAVAERTIPGANHHPTAEIPAGTSQPTGIVPNAPPSGRPASEVASRGRGRGRRPSERSFQLTLPGARPPNNGAWWEQVTIRSDDLLIPAEWVPSLVYRRDDFWPQLSSTWTELLIPEGWEQPLAGSIASMLLVDADLLIPYGW